MIGRFSPSLGRFILESASGWQNIFDVPVSSAVIPLAGDWNGDGKDSVGWYDPVASMFYLKNTNEAGAADKTVQFGPPNAGWLPVVGDWNGDGKTTIGLYDPHTSRFYLRNSNTPGPAEVPNQHGFQFGAPQAHALAPLAGDWDGNGRDTIGLYYPPTGQFLLRNSNAPGPADLAFVFGGPKELPVVINGDGSSTVGVLYPWHYDVNPPPAPSNCYYPFLIRSADGSTRVQSYANRGMGWLPISGKWKPSSHEPPAGNTTPAVPSWCVDPILYQLRIDTFTPEGTFAAATARLGYLADLGVTILMLTPVSECYRIGPPSITDNYYNVLEPDVIDSSLGSEADLAAFVLAAHAHGLRVLLDIVPHGVNPHSSLVSAHPDWFVKDADGHYIVEWGIGQPQGNLLEFDHTQPAVQGWWLATLLNFVQDLGVDGFRCDLEPTITGFTFWPKVISAAKALGKELFIVSENITAKRNYAYHVSQEDAGLNSPMGGPDFLAGTGPSLENFLSDSSETFLSSALSTANRTYGVKGRSVYAAYGCLLTPPRIVPVLYMGEEANVPASDPLYFSRPDWTQTDPVALADFKKLVRFRRQWKDRQLGLVPLA